MARVPARARCSASASGPRRWVRPAPLAPGSPHPGRHRRSRSSRARGSGCRPGEMEPGCSAALSRALRGCSLSIPEPRGQPGDSPRPKAPARPGPVPSPERCFQGIPPCARSGALFQGESLPVPSPERCFQRDPSLCPLRSSVSRGCSLQQAGRYAWGYGPRMS